MREKLLYTLPDVHSARALNDIVHNVAYNQYNMYGTIPAVHNATAGLIRESANRLAADAESSGTGGESGENGENGEEAETFDEFFERLHETARENLTDFFSGAEPFMRN
jgi:hypothetical protein